MRTAPATPLQFAHKDLREGKDQDGEARLLSGAREHEIYNNGREDASPAGVAKPTDAKYTSIGFEPGTARFEV